MFYIFTEPEDIEDEPVCQKHRIRRVFYKICGIPEENVTVAVDKFSLQVEQFMTETPFIRDILNFNAFFGILVIVFLFGYFH